MISTLIYFIVSAIFLSLTGISSPSYPAMQIFFNHCSVFHIPTFKQETVMVALNQGNNNKDSAFKPEAGKVKQGCSLLEGQ